VRASTGRNRVAPDADPESIVSVTPCNCSPGVLRLFLDADDLFSGRLGSQVRMLADGFESAYDVIIVEFLVALLRVEHYIV
jgi:hypothetical protein